LSSDSGEEYVPVYHNEGEEEVEEVEEEELPPSTGRIRRSTTKMYKEETVSIQKQ